MNNPKGVLIDTKKRLEHQYKCPIWVSAEGDLYPLRIMTHRYLQNCLRRVRYRIKTECISVFGYPAPNGEMAQELYYSNEYDEEDESYRLRIFLRRWESKLMDECGMRGMNAGEL